MEDTWARARASYIGEMRNIGPWGDIVDCGQAVLESSGGPYAAAYMRMNSCYGYTAPFTAADLVYVLSLLV